MKWPIIHLPHIPTQRALYEELIQLGCQPSYGGWTAHDAIRWPYLSITNNDISFQCDYTPGYAIMNSPRQFLSYLSRLPK